MENRHSELYDRLLDFHFLSPDSSKDFASLLWKNIEMSNRQDKYVSIVFIDLARYPVGLFTRYHSSNLAISKELGYSKSGKELEMVYPLGVFHNLTSSPNLVVIDDVDSINNHDPVHPIEKDKMQKSGWKSVIFHSMFVDNVVFGYIAVFSLDRVIFQKEIDRITNFLGEYMPFINEKLLGQAYQHLKEAYTINLEEIHRYASDFTLSITHEGMIVQSNSGSNLYFGKAPKEIIGANLEIISQPLYDGILKSVQSSELEEAITVQLVTPGGMKRTIEINAWESSISDDKFIICILTDLTWIFETKHFK
jgi:hypothetical protein